MNTPNDRTNPGKNNPSENVTQEAKAAASNVSEQAKQQAKGQLNQSKEAMGEQVDKLAHAAQVAAADLKQRDDMGLSSYVSDMANNMSSLAENLRGKNVDELVSDVSSLAKNNPALFIAGSIAVGFGISRLAKSASNQAGQSLDSNRSVGGGSSWSNEKDNERSYTTSGYPNEDYGTRESQSLAGEPLISDESTTTSNLGGKRYE